MNVQHLLIAIVSVIGAYLIGSISSAILVCKVFRLPDPRTEGSKNPGTTNVLRVGGKLPAFFTLVGDVAKGAIPVALVKTVTDNPYIIGAVVLAAVIGHIFPIFYKGKGGKGIATMIGALFALSLTLGAIYILCWIGVFALFRISSLSGIFATATMPFWAWGFLDHRYSVGLGLLALIVLIRHKDNMMRIWLGQEKKTIFKRD
jgi:glycerol-3-phosphate acyltransferase PlsY